MNQNKVTGAADICAQLTKSLYSICSISRNLWNTSGFLRYTLATRFVWEFISRHLNLGGGLSDH